MLHREYFLSMIVLRTAVPHVTDSAVDCVTPWRSCVAKIGQYWLPRFSLDMLLHESTRTNPKCQVCCNFTHLVWYCSLNSHLCPDLIFFTNIMNYIRGEKIAMWRNFSFPCITIVGKLKISPSVEKFQMSPHDRCGDI